MIQNNDIIVKINLTNADGSGFDITLYTTYEIYIYTKEVNTKKYWATYKSSNTNIYKIVVNTVSQLQIVLNRQLTSQLPIGNIYAEIRLRQNATSDFISSLENTGANEILIGVLDSSANLNSLT